MVATSLSEKPDGETEGEIETNKTKILRDSKGNYYQAMIRNALHFC